MSRLEDVPTYIHLPDEERTLDFEGVLPLPVGTFVAWNDGRVFRVSELWYSFDHHGPWDDGCHIVLELTERKAPGYD
jgi:hypothetical protein